MPLPPRRWFQFRLSTWFVLVAILAWGLSARPYFDREWNLVSLTGSTDGNRKVLGAFPGELDDPAFHDWLQDTAEPARSTKNAMQLESNFGINPGLLYPALALAAFVGWKAAWAVGRRVKARKVEQA